MELDEAIEVLKDFAKQVKVKSDGAYQTDKGMCACRLSVEALRKQIPMKPTEINDECGYFECPSCGELIYADGARFEEHKYCLSCGQKLDWRNDI